MKKCEVTVIQENGTITYIGLFKSTMDAILDAMDRFNTDKITAKVLTF